LDAVNIALTVSGQEKLQLVYKAIDGIHLKMDIYLPPSVNPAQSSPAMVFFFGGGWNGGSVSQFEPHARYFSERGIVCILADYRVKNRQGTTPFESLKDAKSAIRFIRKHSEKYGIDPAKIIASGGSAGGHLAAATAFAEQWNDTSDDLDVSCIPMLLYFSTRLLTMDRGGYGYNRIGQNYKDFSPLHNINKGAPPTIFFLGTRDNLIPVETAEYYKTVMEKVGSRCELFLFEGAGHGFFNFKNPEYYNQTVRETDQFLVSLGYLKGEPTIK